MAIAKIKTRKMEFTVQSLIELGIAAALAVASLIMIAIAVSRFRLKVALSEAIYNHDTNRVGVVPDNCKNALARDSENPWARELLAKVLTDAGKLEDAESEYKQIAALGRPSVHCGFGVIFLKRADRATDPKTMRENIELARKAFGAARAADANCAEAAIGLAHADLLLYVKTGDSSALGSARTQFDKIKKDLDGRFEYRANATREGLVDFYAGMGKVYSVGGTYSPEAAGYFKACYQYAPKWVLPLVNLVAMEAQRFNQNSFTSEQLNGQKMDMELFSSNIRALWTNNSANYGALRDPWLQRELAIAHAWARAGRYDEFDRIMHNLISTFQAQMEPYYLKTYVRTWIAFREEYPDAQTQYTYVQLALSGTDEFFNHATMGDDRNKALRPIVRNNAAALEAWIGSFDSAVYLEKAEKSFADALRMDPENPILNRNYAILLKRRGNPPDKIRPYLDKAKSCRDYAEVEKYVQGGG